MRILFGLRLRTKQVSAQKASFLNEQASRFFSFLRAPHGRASL